MSISNALANALTGLNASSRSAEVVSSNVANSMTEGYGRREIELTAQLVGRAGAGVSVVGVNRVTNPVVTGERRIADAEVALADTRTDYYSRLERALGQPDDEGSISGRITQLETTLVEAASRPDSEARLTSVLNAAKGVADKINSAADEIMAIRTEADHKIADTVEVLQTSLQRVVDLNVAIQQATSSGYDANTLMDQRQVLIDQISEIVPVKEVPRENNMVSLYTPGGAILVDHKAADIGFSSVNTITPDMTVASGALSGLTINGQPVSTDANKGAISGGKLSGLFEVRDVLAVDAQVRLDAVARDLIERFESPSVDGTLNPGDPGLFTDDGAALDITEEESLSHRLKINGLAVDPDQGGALWRLRDGINAVTPGDQGNGALLLSMSDALSTTRQVASGGFSAINRSALGLSSDLYSLVATQHQNVDSDMAFSSARQDSLISQERAEGVDTDHEMQQLLLIERAYAANARVISTVDDLIDQLLRI